MISSAMMPVAKGRETRRPTPIPTVAFEISLKMNTNDKIARIAM